MTESNKGTGKRGNGNGSEETDQDAGPAPAAPQHFQWGDDGSLSFTFDRHVVRIVMQDGAPWFVAADVCRAMQLSANKGGYASHLEKLDADEKRTVDRGSVLTATPGFNPGVPEGHDSGHDLHDDSTDAGPRPIAWIVSESGLYTLMLRSRDATTPGTLPHRFRRWVTHEVLPALRRTGRYEMNGQEADLPPPYYQERFIREEIPVTLPGHGRYIVITHPERPPHIHRTAYDAVLQDQHRLPNPRPPAEADRKLLEENQGEQLGRARRSQRLRLGQARRQHSGRRLPRAALPGDAR